MNNNKDFEKIILKIQPRIYRYCLIRLKDTYLADEAWQKFMIVINNKWSDLEVGKYFKSYCIKVANNCIKQVIENNERFYSRHESLDAMTVSAIFSKGSVEDTYFDDCDDEKYIEQIINGLSQEERQLFVYRFVEKKTFNEISELTGIPYSTVRYRLNKIEEMIKTEIKKFFN